MGLSRVTLDRRRAGFGAPIRAASSLRIEGYSKSVCEASFVYENLGPGEKSFAVFNCFCSSLNLIQAIYCSDIMSLTVKRTLSVGKDNASEHGMVSIPVKGKRKDRRKSVWDGVYVSISFKKDRRVLKDRRRAC